MSNTLKKVIGVLKAIKGLNDNEIAEEIGYSRPYLNVILNKKNPKERDKILIAIKKKWPIEIEQIDRFLKGDSSSIPTTLEKQEEGLLTAMLQRQNLILDRQNNILERLATNVESKVERIDSNLIDALGRVDGLRFDLYAGIQVGLESLGKLQGLKPGALLKQADNIKLGLLKELSGQSKSAGKGK